MKNYFYFILFLVSFTVNLAYGQIGKSKLYLAIDDYGEVAKAFLKKQGNKGVKVILGDKIYPDKPDLNQERYVNSDTIAKYIVKAFPDKNAKGIGVLDWEGRSFDILILFPSDSPVYQFVLKEFLKALKIAKELRPNVSWGYYGIPFKKDNFKSVSEWNIANDKIAPLLESCDVFCPNLYLYSPNNLDVSIDVKKSVGLAIKYNKKVFPFIWQRYNGIENGECRFDVMQKKDFVDNYVVTILKTKFKNKKVNGVIWWSFDTYFYLHNEEAFLKEAVDFKSFIKKYDNTIIDYSSGIINAYK